MGVKYKTEWEATIQTVAGLQKQLRAVKAERDALQAKLDALVPESELIRIDRSLDIGTEPEVAVQLSCAHVALIIGPLKTDAPALRRHHVRGAGLNAYDLGMTGDMESNQQQRDRRGDDVAGFWIAFHGLTPPLGYFRTALIGSSKENFFRRKVTFLGASYDVQGISIWRSR